MEIIDLVGEKGIVIDLKASSKKQVISELARCASEASGIDERTVFDVIVERERLGSTGVGGGVAIPHGRLADLDKIYGVFANLEKPVDFESVDEKPVDLVFMLLAPEGAGADHLKALAKVSRMLRDETMCSKLRGSKDKDTVTALIKGLEIKKSA